MQITRCYDKYIKGIGAGALEGLIGKSGESPARSRHCKAERIRKCHWETGKAGGAGKPSQENCLLESHHLTYERWEGDAKLGLQRRWSSCPLFLIRERVDFCFSRLYKPSFGGFAI